MSTANPAARVQNLHFMDIFDKRSVERLSAMTGVSFRNVGWSTNGHKLVQHATRIERVYLPLLTTFVIEGSSPFALLPFIDAPNLKSLELTVTSTDRFPRLCRRGDEYKILARFLRQFLDQPQGTQTKKPLSRILTLKIYDNPISDREWPEFLAQKEVMNISNVQIYFETPAARVARYLEKYKDAFVTLGGANGPDFAVYRDVSPAATNPERSSYLGWHMKPGTWKRSEEYHQFLELAYSPKDRMLFQRSSGPAGQPIAIQRL
ncbi:hypothetical protein NLJ89_g4925 [Agrocybe chaxingu]|uniref:Uncharacterized protein n=1 Tax=Agrocybe chaxingu TaxID=84603 RepID=A0A9W8MU35_9AGAR|nr:hypothetical protein NLJ89_g4925 [Agrocybe chaxingu]